MKRLLSIFVALVLAIMCCMTAYAEMTTFAIGSEKRASTLVISGTTATCTSQYVAANNNVSKVFITQTLEKHSFLWAWETVGGTRTKTVNGSSASLTGKVTVRLKDTK